MLMFGMLEMGNSSLSRLKALFLSREFRLFFLLSVILNEIYFHFEPTNLGIKTYSDIFYDFSGSWRNHIYRYLTGEQLYQDFYYPYPPMGFYIMSGLFYITGPSVFYQTIATSIVAIIVHIGIFLLVEKKVRVDHLKTIVLIASLFFLNASKHELFLGGNPFPLLLGFAFFVFALLFVDRIEISTLLVLIAASCKHEFWIGAFLLISFFVSKNYKTVLPILLGIVLVNLLLGFNTLDVITGMGRSSWARWNFHWEGVLPQMLLFLPVLLAKRFSVLFLLMCLITLVILHSWDVEMIRNSPLFLIFLFFLLLAKPKSVKFIFVFLIIFSLQMRRGFEWGEYTFNALLPIYFGFIWKDESRLAQGKATLVLASLFLLSIYQFTLRNLIHLPSNDADFNLHRTEIGSLISKNDETTFIGLNDIIKNKSVLTFPFCSGVSLLSQSKFTSPVTYFYSRDRVKTFDYYDQEIGMPEFIIIDENYLSWNDYPFFENTLLKWKLGNERVNLAQQYPEIFDLLEESYKRIKVIDNFSVYERNN